MNVKEYKPGQVMTVQGFIVQPPYSPSPTFHYSEMGQHGYVTICPHTLTFTVPAGFNATAAEIASIDTALEVAAKAYYETIADLRSRRDALRQITYEACPSHDTTLDAILDADADAALAMHDIDDNEPGDFDVIPF